ncbi:hypothetical protein BB561_003490 [Smittium simulii]|uniref:Uncharacterized protein n=1 Tax=Smittium simulii TaxID=133385 RepID=A0A2T9YL10_9FUNG|nr:hypothetical protein BB561_003490 [Smittium simulii]
MYIRTRFISAALMSLTLLYLLKTLDNTSQNLDSTSQSAHLSNDDLASNPYTRINAPYDYIPSGDKSLSGTMIKAAFVTVVRNEDAETLRITIKQLDDRFNKNYAYPYILLNDEDFSLSFKKNIMTATKAPVYFGKIDKNMWGYSKGIDIKKLKKDIYQKKFDYFHGDSISYRMMSRFYSNFIHQHPLLRNLDYFWRFRNDVKYFCDLDFDPFLRMKTRGYKYGWVISPTEFAETVTTLWNTTATWILKNPTLLPEQSFAKWVISDNNDYNLCHFWSNFEIVDLNFLRSKAYQSYVDTLDNARGYFYERWGDAPVRSIAAALLLSKKEIHWFEEIGYQFTGEPHCPKLKHMFDKCAGCDYKGSAVYNSECYKHFVKTNDIPKDQLLSIIRNYTTQI